MRKVQLECIVFRKTQNNLEFLLLKRISEKGGFWQPVCGGLEKEDNSKLDGAYRELLEETNISKKDIIRVLEEIFTFEINKHYLTGKPIPAIKEYVYGFEVHPETVISIDNNICIEHEEFKWVDFEEALNLLKWENNKQAFERLHSLIVY